MARLTHIVNHMAADGLSKFKKIMYPFFSYLWYAVIENLKYLWHHNVAKWYRIKKMAFLCFVNTIWVKLLECGFGNPIFPASRLTETRSVTETICDKEL